MFVAFLAVAIGIWVYTSKKGLEKLFKKTARRIAVASFWLGLSGLTLYWLTYQRVYIIGARFMYLLWFALLAWYVWSIGRYILVVLPEQKKRKEERDAIEKWIPKKSK